MVPLEGYWRQWSVNFVYRGFWNYWTYYAFFKYYIDIFSLPYILLDKEVERYQVFEWMKLDAKE